MKLSSLEKYLQYVQMQAEHDRIAPVKMPAALLETMREGSRPAIPNVLEEIRSRRIEIGLRRLQHAVHERITQMYRESKSS